MERFSHLKADLVLLLVTILAAFGWIFSKETLTELPPLLFLGIRFFTAGLFLFITHRGSWKTLSHHPLKEQVWQLGGIMAVALLFWIQGLAKTENLGVGSFITSLGVVFVPLVAWLMFREPIGRSTQLAVPVAVFGLGFLSLDGGLSSDPGHIFFLVAAALFSVQFTLISRIAAKVPAIPLTAAQLMVVGIVGFAVSALTENWPSSVSVEIWGWLLASILFATSLRFSLQTYGQSLAPVSHAALIMILEPVWTALAAAFWFDESMAALEIFGCLLIFSALIIGRWSLLISKRA